VQILIMDEPMSSLTDKEKRALFRLMASLKQQGVSILYVSRFLDEVLEICDRVTVLKDGERVAIHAVSEITKAKLIQQSSKRPARGEDQAPRGASASRPRPGLIREPAERRAKVGVDAGPPYVRYRLTGASRS
jgi:ABC-type sugar transport system ATPase subunit